MTRRTTIHQLFNLSGKVALVTGSRNLGYDMAEALAELGATVIVTSRDQAIAEQHAALLAGTTGANVKGMALEVSNEQSWQHVIASIVQKYEKIDILVNNAGGRKVTNQAENHIDSIVAQYVEQRELEEWKQSLDNNLTSVFLGCKTVTPYMKEAGYGKIINIASIDGIVGRDLRIYQNTGFAPTVPDYLACKAGVIQLTKGYAVALAPYGIYVNAISPGGFERNQPQSFIANYSQLVPLQRMGRDRIDIKGAIAYLASAASDYTVGHNLVVDGGLTTW